MTGQIDIAELLVTNSIRHLVAASVFHTSKDHIAESEECIQSVLLFQVAMEAIINEEIERAKPLEPLKKENKELARKFKSLTFRNKWERTFDLLEIKKRKELNFYLKFYGKYRNLVSHPKSRYVSLEHYDFKKVYEGIKNGWLAVDHLYLTLGKTRISWEEVCRDAGLSI